MTIRKTHITIEMDECVSNMWIHKISRNKNVDFLPSLFMISHPPFVLSNFTFILCVLLSAWNIFFLTFSNLYTPTTYRSDDLRSYCC